MPRLTIVLRVPLQTTDQSQAAQAAAELMRLINAYTALPQSHRTALLDRLDAADDQPADLRLVDAG